MKGTRLRMIYIITLIVSTFVLPAVLVMIDAENNPCNNGSCSDSAGWGSFVALIIGLLVGIVVDIIATIIFVVLKKKLK